MGFVVSLISAVLCVFLGLGMVQAETVDRIVAVVNGDVILYSELQSKVDLLKQGSPEFVFDDPERAGQLEREVLQRMIQDRLTQQEVKRLKIVVSPREVDATLESIKKENGLSDEQMEYLLQQEGKTLDQLRQEIMRNLERARLIERVLRSKTVITEDQIDAYLKSNQLDGQKRFRLAVIFLPFEAGAGGDELNKTERLVRDIHDRLKSGTDFGRMAREHSKGPAAQEGGDIGYIGSDELAPPIREAVEKLKTNDITPPIRASAGYYLVKVLDIQSEKLSDGDAGQREKARRQLFEREVNQKFEKWVQELEARSFIQTYL